MTKRNRESDLKEVNLLDLTPVRVADSEARGKLVVILRPKPEGRGLGALTEWMVYMLSASRIRLDSMGSYAWRRLDGRITVRNLASELRQEFGESAEPIEERLGHLVRVLRREGLIAYPGWDQYDTPAHIREQERPD